MIYYLLLLLLCSAFTCSRTENNEEIVPVSTKLCPEDASYKENQGQITFEFRLMNTKGQVTNCFKEGEDVLFQWLAINNMDTSLIWGNSYDNFETGDRLQLYVKNSNGTKILLSKPKKGVFCHKISNISIPAKDTVKMFTSWGDKVETVLNGVRPFDFFIKKSYCFWNALGGGINSYLKGIMRLSSIQK
jgi:hypothetical protein